MNLTKIKKLNLTFWHCISKVDGNHSYIVYKL